MRNDAISQRVVPIVGAHGRPGRRLYLRVYRRLQQYLRLGKRPERRLRLCESLALGERRFVAVIEFERQRFLLGGTGQSLALLAQLGETVDHEPKSVKEEQR
jgi:flagellar biogenesis protein FliO